MHRIDTFPTHKIGELEYRVGMVFPFGATLLDGGVNFSIFSKEAESCTLLLYHHSEKKPFAEIEFPEEFRIGNVYTMLVFGINIETTEYGYRFGGNMSLKKGFCLTAQSLYLTRMQSQFRAGASGADRQTPATLSSTEVR